MIATENILLFLVVVIAIGIAKIPAQLGDAGFVVDVAQIGKTHLKVIIFGFQLVKSSNGIKL